MTPNRLNSECQWSYFEWWSLRSNSLKRNINSIQATSASACNNSCIHIRRDTHFLCIPMIISVMNDVIMTRISWFSYSPRQGGDQVAARGDEAALGRGAAGPDARTAALAFPEGLIPWRSGALHPPRSTTACDSTGLTHSESYGYSSLIRSHTWRIKGSESCVDPCHVFLWWDTGKRWSLQCNL